MAADFRVVIEDALDQRMFDLGFRRGQRSIVVVGLSGFGAAPRLTFQMDELVPIMGLRSLDHVRADSALISSNSSIWGRHRRHGNAPAGGY